MIGDTPHVISSQQANVVGVIAREVLLDSQ